MPVDLAMRFWSHVDQTAGPDGCWPWQLSRRKDGYGQVSVNHRMTAAHRVAFALDAGEMPVGQVVRHRCDNPPCCNPRHLRIGTQADNLRDMLERGRHVTVRKIDDEAVDAIRSASGTQREIAAQYGVAQSLVSMIRNNKRRTRAR